MIDIVERAEAALTVYSTNSHAWNGLKCTLIRDLVAELKATRNVLAGLIIERDDALAEVNRLQNWAKSLASVEYQSEEQQELGV